jgi:hypothetical protein
MQVKCEWNLNENGMMPIELKENTRKYGLSNCQDRSNIKGIKGETMFANSSYT